jgi:hypothetical protein
MTDQDLIDYQLAAKAAGYVLTFKHGSCKGGAYCGAFIERGGEVVAWRPKECDGDAFRLSVDAHIDTKHHAADGYVVGWFDDFFGTGFITYGCDRRAATRLAVFCAAVERGRAKQ